MPTLHIFETAKLIPEAWKKMAAVGPTYAFNPSLMRLEASWLLAYRIVLADGLRRIAFCRLNEGLEPIPDSTVPFSDLIRFEHGAELAPQALQWFADPRLYRLGGRCCVYWNSGWHEPQNHQFLQEFDPSSLTPMGAPRELRLQSRRQPIEKNWTFWGEDSLFACYSPSPHRVLGFDLGGEGPIRFLPAYEHSWNNRIYERRFGQLRGGGAPILKGEVYFSVCHSMHGAHAESYHYEAALYGFSAKAPFTPVFGPHRPLPLPESPPRSLPTLNRAVGRVIYPCGLASTMDGWLMSYGINDERCAIAQFSEVEVKASLIDIQT